MSDERVGVDSGTTSRRQVLAGVGMAGAAAGAATLLAACGTEPEDTFEIPQRDAPTTPGTPSSEASAEATEEPEPESDDDQDVAGLAAADDVSVGGGLILEDEGLVITQPSAGEWRGFSATCTHQGCLVTSVEDGTINCACHGSKFSIEDGSVVNGPAGSPLASQDVQVQDGQVVLA